MAPLPMIGDHRPTRVPVDRSWAVDDGDLLGLEWEGSGAGPAVLAVHGIAGNATAWALVADRLRTTRILAPDLRGRGRSNGLPGPWSIDRLADDLACVLDDADIDRAVIVGHALGAFIGVRFAELYPERVEALVLVNGGLPVPPENAAVDGDGAADGDALPQALCTHVDTKTLPSRADHREAWREHSALGPWWNAAMASFVDAGLQRAPEGGFMSAALPEAIRENARELDGGRGYAEALLALRTTLAFIRAPKGCGSSEPVYSPEYAEDWVTRIAGIANVEADATNPHTVLLAPHGADVTAAVVRGVIEIGIARERARAAHPATGRLRVVRPVKPIGSGRDDQA